MTDDVKDHVICGLLLCLRQLIPLVTADVDDDTLLLPKIYCLLLRCCLHNNHNVVTSALEALSVLLCKPVTGLMVWLTTEIDHMISLCPISSDDSTNNDDVNVPPPSSYGDALVSSSPSGSDTALSSYLITNAPSTHNDILSDTEQFPPPSPIDSDIPLPSSSSDSDIHAPTSPSGSDGHASPSPSGSDGHAPPSPSGSDKCSTPVLSDDSDPTHDNDESLLMSCDDHFVVSLSTTDASVSVSMASAHPTSVTPLLSCDIPDVDVTALQLPGVTTCRTPIQVLLQLLGKYLQADHVRVSVKAVAMQCIVAIATWSPQQLLIIMEAKNNPKLIELLLPYMEFDDPKLCGNCCQVLSYYIKGLILWDSDDRVLTVSSAVGKLVKVLNNNTATVLHTAIPSLQVSFYGYYMCAII